MRQLEFDFSNRYKILAEQVLNFPKKMFTI